MMRFEKGLSELRGRFIADFQKLMDEAFGFERLVGGWLSETTNELKEILSESSTMRPFVCDDSSFLAQLAGIQSLLPKGTIAKPEVFPESPFTTALLERPRALLTELMNERTQLDQVRLDNEEAERAHQQSRVLAMSLEARNLEIDIEKDAIAKQLAKFRTEQTEEFERSFDVVQTFQESERSTLRSSLESLIDQLRNAAPRRPSARLVDFRTAAASHLSDLSMANNQLWMKVECLARSVQLFEAHGQTMPMPMPPALSVSFPAEEPAVDATIAEVEEKLAGIRRRRAEVMRDVTKLYAQLSLE
jgi:hypothetical protein